MKTPRLSILLPVHNGARFLDEQIASVLAQTCGDFELLVQDDASSDGSPEAVSRWAGRDSRVSVTRSAVNLGQRETLRHLLHRARADVIAFCDQDDIWEPAKLDRLLERLPPNGLSYGSSSLIDETGRSLERTLFDHVGPPFQGRNALELLRGNTVSAHAMLVDRRCIVTAALADGSVFDWTIALVAAAQGGIVCDPEAITYHRQHGGNFNNRLDLAGKRFRTDGSERIASWARHFEALSQHPDAKTEAAAAFRDFAARLDDWSRPEARSCFRDRALFETGLVALDHLDGSTATREAVLKSLRKLARGNWHPRVIVRSLRVAAA